MAWLKDGSSNASEKEVEKERATFLHGEFYPIWNLPLRNVISAERRTWREGREGRDVQMVGVEFQQFVRNTFEKL